MRFRAAQPEIPVYLVSVRRSREVARHIAERTGIQHESPQVLVLRRGDVVATASHDAITSEFLAGLVANEPAANEGAREL
jgi:bacillithiol system protein YtxJ